MFSDKTTSLGSGPSPVLAGVVAGLVTLGLVMAIVSWLGTPSAPSEPRRPQLGEAIDPSALDNGDCLNRETATLVLASCSSPHSLQAVARIAYPDADGPFPGVDELRGFARTACVGPVEDYLDGDLLDTDLDIDISIPSLAGWNADDQSITCFVTSTTGEQLVGSIEGAAEDFARGSEIRVDRLKIDDCFSPAGGVDPYSLSGGSTVLLSDCDGTYNGLFFGRDELAVFASSTGYPGDTEISEIANTRCGELFTENFDVASEGFNYRFWRPNEQTWENGDRTVLCAILDVEPLSGLLDPKAFVPFFMLDSLDCFNLGPEETTASLRLNDQVLPSPCTSPSNGQIVVNGLLTDESVPAPSTEDIETAAVDRCGEAYQEFVDGSVSEVDLGNFTLWYPTFEGWTDGDRRFACAFVDDTKRQASL